MKTIAIIPARGGSKRILGKNIRPFLSKPIIAYSINAAISSGLFDEVMVSTDSDDITSIAIQHGAKVPFKRSEKNADDHATTVDVILEVLNWYKNDGKQFDLGCCIYPAAPFVTPSLLGIAYDKLVDENLDTTFPVLPFNSPIQRAFKLNSDDHPTMFYPEFMQKRSQDLEPAFHDSGQFYWFTTQYILNSKKLYSHRSGAIVLSEMDAQDIDHESDWEIAELKYKLKFES